MSPPSVFGLSPVGNTETQTKLLSVTRPKWCHGSSGPWWDVSWQWTLCFSQSGRLSTLLRSKKSAKF